MELWNFKVKSLTGQWTGARTATMKQDFDYPGSYNYGAEGDRFWAITTGIPNKAQRPVQFKQVSVSGCDMHDPY